jgi:hypothetical protein
MSRETDRKGEAMTEETKRASEMTIEQIEEVLREMDWTEIHKLYATADYGDHVMLYSDGSFNVMHSSTHYRDPDAAGVIGSIRCPGSGNLDTTYYTEGWTRPEKDEDGYDTGNYVVEYGFEDEDNGKVLTLDEAIEMCIEIGEHDYDEWIDGVLEREREYRRHAAEEAYGA